MSAPWYMDIFGLVELLSGDDDLVTFRLLGDSDSRLIIGLRQYKTAAPDRFSEFRTGLDHLAVGVQSRRELSLREAHLTKKGVVFSPSADTPIGTVLVFRDPDGIQLEFWLPASVV